VGGDGAGPVVGREDGDVVDDPVRMHHPVLGITEEDPVERQAYRQVYYQRGWRSDDDPGFTGVVDPDAPRNPGIDLESVGAQVDQTAGRVERDRWLALIRDAGSTTPNHETLRYIGGDASDSVKTTTGAVLWVCADYFARPGSSETVNQNTDVYAINPFTGLRRNGLIVEASPGGTFTQQVYRAPFPSDWINAEADGGHPATHNWWPSTIIQQGEVTYVACIFVEIPAVGTVWGFREHDIHLVELNMFGLYQNHIPLGLDPRRFRLETLRKDATHFYIVGSEVIPPIDAATGNPAYAVGDLATLRGQRAVVRIARVPIGQLTAVANWRFWNGVEWVEGLDNAEPLRDVHGYVVDGQSSIHQVTAGRWILVTTKLADTHLSVYNAAVPQGPWRLHARVPVPVSGKYVESGLSVAWHPKVIGHLAAPPEHSVASLIMFITGMVGTFQGINVRRVAPQFIVVPWY
jgi:hypothetical protein